MRVDSKSGLSTEARHNLLILLGAALVAALFYPQFSLNHDSSWYLVSTEMYLNGAGLYTDILEINPPLAFYLTVPPVALANALSSDPTEAYIMYSIAIGVGSSLWSLAILHRSNLSLFARRAFLATILIVLFALPIAEFGQREHLMLLFAMPFFLSVLLRNRSDEIGGMHQIALGLAASVGLLLKPYFLLIPAAMGLMRLWQERNPAIFLDRSYLALAAATIAYLIFIFWGHPAYLERIVPFATEVYASYGMDVRSVLLRAELVALLVLGIAIWRFDLASDRISQMLLAANVAAALLYLLQFKGWNYQILPLAAFEAITVGWILIRRHPVVRKDAVAAILLMLALVMTLGIQLARGPYTSASSASFSKFVEREGQSILVLSTNVSASFPFVNEVSGKWASHYSAQWLIPGAYDKMQSVDCEGSEDKCASSAKILEFSRNSIIVDIERYDPDLIFVDERERKAYFQSTDFDYFAFLSHDQRFRNLVPCYSRAGETLGFGVFEKTCETHDTDSMPDTASR